MDIAALSVSLNQINTSNDVGVMMLSKALDTQEQLGADERGAGQVPLALAALEDCIPAAGSAEQIIDDLALTDVLNRFLSSLPAEKRLIFLRRYWYLSPVAEIAEDLSLSESKVKMSLLRSRKELKLFLEKEGVDL